MAEGDARATLKLSLLGLIAASLGAACGGAAPDPDPGIGETQQASTAGACVFSAPAAAGVAADVDFSIRLPAGVKPEQVALGSTGASIDVGDGVRVTKAAGGGYAATSAVESTTRLRVGVDANVGNVFSEPAGVDLKNRAHVHGFVNTAATVSKASQAIVDAGVFQNTSLRPLEAVTWRVAFPAADRGSCNVKSDRTESLAPGAYGDITLKPRARLRLRGGTYYFRSLSFEPGSVLDADNSAGPVLVNVRRTFSFKGRSSESRPERTLPSFAVAGTGVDVSGDFRGTLVAPFAKVVLSESCLPGYEGAFFAKGIQVQPNVTVRHRPFTVPNPCPSGGVCSSTCPCPTGGMCRGDSDCVAGLACIGATATSTGICQPPNVDDGNPCTADSLDPAIGIRHDPLPQGTSCSDGEACNGTESCDGAGACQSGSPPNLDDRNPCTADSCNAGSGVAHDPLPAGSACPDQDLCNGAESCDASGTCQPGLPPSLDDGNPCTTDVCDSLLGPSHVPVLVGTSCADPNPCNGDEICDGNGVCQLGIPSNLDDGNPCTADSCDPVRGPVHDPVPAGTSCADADRCNGDEVCSATGQCAGGAPSLVDDANPCTTDVCEPTTGVRHDPVTAGTSCDDGEGCNGVDLCDGNGACVPGAPPVVDDGNPCTTDRCDAGGIVHEPLPLGTSCNDGDACNGSEACSSDGHCAAGIPPVLDDGNSCTVDTCDASSGVQHAPRGPGAPCGDTNPCNGDETCDGNGQCVIGPAPSLDDANPCTADSCDTALGVRHDALPADTDCGNADACDGVELCDDNGACQPGAAPPVDDGNPCTTDHCAPASGPIHEDAPAGTPCGDGNACNGGELCDGAGVCESSTPQALLTVTGPPTGFLTREGATPVTGTTHGSAEVTVTVEGTGASVTLPAGPQPFTLSAPLVEGENQLTVHAADANGCSATEDLLVILDATPPVVALTVPDSVSASNPAQASVTASDTRGVVEVQLLVLVDGEIRAEQSRAAPPYTFDFGVPSGVDSDRALTITARAIDEAGNVAEATKSVTVAADAIVMGRVLFDVSGLPVAGAGVSLGSQTAVSRQDGSYALPAADARVLVSVSRAGFTTVERGVDVQFGVGTVAVDARLTPLAEAVELDGPVSLEATLGRTDGDAIGATLTVPAGALGAASSLRMTPLSAQGLPALLPYGWSPVAAFDLASDPATVEAPLSLALTELPAEVFLLATYDGAVHGYRVVATNLAPVTGALGIPLNGLGSFVLIVPDSSVSPAAPSPGEVLTGVPAAPLPAALTAQGSATPASLSAGGGLVQGYVALPSPGDLPSGTLVQVALRESYSLTSPRLVSTEPRLEDLVLFRGRTSATPLLAATFPIVPSRTFRPSELGTGNLHVDVLRGRETYRGKIGGHAAVLVQDGGATLSVESDSLPADTVVDLVSTAVSSDVFSSTELVPLAEVAVDFAGATLEKSAELTFASLPLAPEETPLLARIERVDGTPHPFVVALGTFDGTSFTFGAGDGLAGITREGTYVAYRSTLPLGFVAGHTTTGGAPVQALVTVADLPFVAPAGLDGAYKIPARIGNVAISAKVMGTNLAAQGSATVLATQPGALDLELVGEVTTATVSPASGAVAVPRTTQVLLTTPVALDPASVVPENVKLFAGEPADKATVAVRLEPSASWLSLAVIPEMRLDADRRYTLQASGLRDALGGVVAVPVASFTTAAEVPPQIATDPIQFSMPDGNGNTTITVPPGALEPGTQLLITNEGNGVVVSYSVGNDGALTAELPASIDDRLLVSITDPRGNTTSFTRSQFVGTDGRTAIGPGGGVVKGEGGVEVRVPEGAVGSGVIFKVAPLMAQDFAVHPYIPHANVGGGLAIESEGDPLFSKEVDLAFQKPPEAPDGAFYYVYKRLEGRDGAQLPGGAAFEVIDHAFVEGSGAEARVVTASCPFSGARDTVGKLGLAVDLALTGLSAASLPLHLRHGIAAFRDSVIDAGAAKLLWAGASKQRDVYFLAWSYDTESAALTPTVGLIRGRVVRPAVAAAGMDPIFEPIAGATVFGCDANGQPFPQLPMTVSTTQHDGSYTLWDRFPTEGKVVICADLTGAAAPLSCPSLSSQSNTFRCATPVQEVVATCADNARFYRNQLKANITFPPLPGGGQVAPPAPMEIAVLRSTNGQRSTTGGIALAGEPLILGFRAATYSVRHVDVSHHGATESVNPYDDPLFGQPLGWDRIANLVPSEPGTYTITATAVPVFPGPSITERATFRVIAPGGDATSPILGAAPAIISAATVPANGGEHVPIGIFPRFTFTEPVKNLSVPNNVRLMEVIDDPLPGVHDGNPLDVTLTGIGLDGLPVEIHSTETTVTSLTMEPAVQLKFGTEYKLSVGGSIVDVAQGSEAPALLDPSPYEVRFKTVEPKVIGGTTEQFSSAGIATVGDHAFVVENQYTTGILRAFDMSNPVTPTELLTAQRQMLGRPMDIDAFDDGEGGARVVVVTGPANQSIPSNLRMYHVHRNAQGEWASDWIAGATLASTAVEGIVRRVAVKGQFAYALTTNKGVQFVDLQFAEQLFAQHGGDSSRIRIPFNSDAQGFGQEAVVATIPVLKGSRPAFLSDMKVVSVTEGYGQPLIVVTGELPLVLMNPQTGEILFPPSGSTGVDALFPPPPAPPQPLPPEYVPPEPKGVTRGHAVEMIHRDNRDIAVIAGEREGRFKIVLVDVTNPAGPAFIGETAGLDRPTDVWVKDDLVLVATDPSPQAGDETVQIVNVGKVGAPFVAGKIAGMGGRVTSLRTGVVLAAGFATSGGPTTFGGIRAAIFGVRPVYVQGHVDPSLPSSVACSYSALPGDESPFDTDPEACVGRSSRIAVDPYQDVRISAETDPADAVVSWFAPGGNPSSGAGRNFATRFGTNGAHEIQVWATDAYGSLAIDVQPVTVRELSGRPWTDRYEGSAETSALAQPFRGRVENFLSALSSAGLRTCHDDGCGDCSRCDPLPLGITPAGTVCIGATLRPRPRARLMHWAWRIWKRPAFSYTATNCSTRLPWTQTGISPELAGQFVAADREIAWVHRHPDGAVDLEASQAAAQEMVDAYCMTKLEVAPSLCSKHLDGLAIDMTVSREGNVSVARGSMDPGPACPLPGAAQAGQMVPLGLQPQNWEDDTALHCVGRTYGVYKRLGDDPPHWKDTP